MPDQPSLFARTPEPPPSGRESFDLADAEPLRLWQNWLQNHTWYLEHLIGMLPWEDHLLRTPAGPIPAPRRECWFGPRDGLPYVYSGERYLSHAMSDSPVLTGLRLAVGTTTGIDFDSCFVNLYRTGRDSIGWHADAEVQALGPLEEIVIASLSLGDRRSFQVKHRTTEEKVSLELGQGDLLLMGRGVQSHYLHAAPKTAKAVGARANITFRRLECR